MELSISKQNKKDQLERKKKSMKHIKTSISNQLPSVIYIMYMKIDYINSLYKFHNTLTHSIPIIINNLSKSGTSISKQIKRNNWTKKLNEAYKHLKSQTSCRRLHISSVYKFSTQIPLDLNSFNSNNIK